MAKPKKRPVKEISSSSSAEASSDEDLSVTLGQGHDTVHNAQPNEATLGTIMSKILRTHVPAPPVDASGRQDVGTATPVLARRKGVERQLEEEKLEKRARVLVRKELREIRDAAHAIPDLSTGNYEKTLRKIGTRGVVQLFNAVHQHQINREKAEKTEKGKKGAKVQTKDKSSDSSPALAKDMQSFSKASFLELLKMGGSNKK